jgi:hypothetical protein
MMIQASKHHHFTIICTFPPLERACQKSRKALEIVSSYGISIDSPCERETERQGERERGGMVVVVVNWWGGWGMGWKGRDLDRLALWERDRERERRDDDGKEKGRGKGEAPVDESIDRATEERDDDNDDGGGGGGELMGRGWERKPKSINQSIDQPPNRSINSLTSQSTDQSTTQTFRSPPLSTHTYINTHNTHPPTIPKHTQHTHRADGMEVDGVVRHLPHHKPDAMLPLPAVTRGGSGLLGHRRTLHLIDRDGIVRGDERECVCRCALHIER